jgi:transposase-like protein
VDLRGHFSNLGTSLKVLVRARSKMLKGEIRRSKSSEVRDLRGLVVRNLKVSQTRLTPDEVTKLVEEYVAGTPVKTLSQRYGVARQTVSEHARRAGVVRKPLEFTDAMVAQAVALYGSGVSLERISEKLGVGPQRVRDTLVRTGVKIRAPRNSGR